MKRTGRVLTGGYTGRRKAFCWRPKDLCADDRVITCLCVLGYIRTCILPYVFVAGPNKHDDFHRVSDLAETSTPFAEVPPGAEAPTRAVAANCVKIEVRLATAQGPHIAVNRSWYAPCIDHYSRPCGVAVHIGANRLPTSDTVRYKRKEKKTESRRLQVADTDSKDRRQNAVYERDILENEYGNTIDRRGGDLLAKVG
jgi:hypothetical protein